MDPSQLKNQAWGPAAKPRPAKPRQAAPDFCSSDPFDSPETNRSSAASTSSAARSDTAEQMVKHYEDQAAALERYNNANPVAPPKRPAPPEQQPQTPPVASQFADEMAAMFECVEAVQWESSTGSVLPPAGGPNVLQSHEGALARWEVATLQQSNTELEQQLVAHMTDCTAATQAKEEESARLRAELQAVQVKNAQLRATITDMEGRLKISTNAMGGIVAREKQAERAHKEQLATYKDKMSAMLAAANLGKKMQQTAAARDAELQTARKQIRDLEQAVTAARGGNGQAEVQRQQQDGMAGEVPWGDVGSADDVILASAVEKSAKKTETEHAASMAALKAELDAARAGSAKVQLVAAVRHREV